MFADPDSTKVSAEAFVVAETAAAVMAAFRAAPVAARTAAPDLDHPV